MMVVTNMEIELTIMILTNIKFNICIAKYLFKRLDHTMS